MNHLLHFRGPFYFCGVIPAPLNGIAKTIPVFHSAWLLIGQTSLPQNQREKMTYNHTTPKNLIKINEEIKPTKHELLILN